MTRSRGWELAITGLIVLTVAYVLFVPPIVGVADQGDYYRLTARVGLRPPDGISRDAQYNGWIVTRWIIGSPTSIPVFSTEEYPVRAAIALHNLATRARALDIRWIAGVHLAWLAALGWAILHSARKLPAPAWFVMVAGLVLVSTDNEYISYFNSFYGESAALLGVFAFVAAGVAAVTAEDLSWFHLCAIAGAAAFLAGSKAQNAVLGALAAGWILWMFRARPHRYVAIGAGALLVGFSAFVLFRAPNPESNLYNAIYGGVLRNTPNPQEALTELGLKPETAAWIQKGYYWDVKPDSADLFPGKATPLRLFVFYLRHPAIDLRMARGALTLSNDLTGLGAFPRESGAPRFARSQAFTGYDRLRARLASIWLVFPLLAANIGAVFLWRTRTGSLLSVLGAMAAVAFLIGTFYDAGPQKHLFTFNLLFDVLLFADLAIAATTWRSFPRSLGMPLGMPLVALLLWLNAGATKDRSFIPDLAQGKQAGQSSTYAGTTAGAAVDGKVDGNFYHDSVSSTDLDQNAWWQVDLETSKTLRSIVLWNRTDCCTSRLNDYWVFISNTPFLASDTPATLQNRAGTFASHQSTASAPSVTIPLSTQGRYVRVQLTGTNYLSLAEVQVFGQ